MGNARTSDKAKWTHRVDKKDENLGHATTLEQHKQNWQDAGSKALQALPNSTKVECCNTRLPRVLRSLMKRAGSAVAGLVQLVCTPIGGFDCLPQGATQGATTGDRRGAAGARP